MAVKRMLIMVKFFLTKKSKFFDEQEQFFDPRLNPFKTYNRKQNGSFLHEDDSDEVF